MSIKLTDKEIMGVLSQAYIGVFISESESHQQWESRLHWSQRRDICKAQLKKVVEIIKRDYPETLFLLEDLKFWHDLLKEAGLK